jgi:hypothetical protein
MKATFCKVAMMIGVAALGTSCLQAQQISEKGAIPFDFQVSGQKIAAGTYTVMCMKTGAGAMLAMRNTETRKSGYLPHAVNKQGEPGESKLVFRKYGDRYFLAEVWFPEENGAHVYPVSRAEKEVATALNTQAPQTVYIAMR